MIVVAAEVDSGILSSGSAMLDFEALSSGKSVPPVDAGDLKRVWELTSKAPRVESATPAALGLSVRVIAGQCSPGADPIAVFFRAALLRPLIEDGLLDEWRDGECLPYVVFQTLGT